MTIHAQVQQLSQETVGKVMVGLGGGGTVFQVATNYASAFIIWGNVVLILAGMYLAFHKVFDKRRNRRETD